MARLPLGGWENGLNPKTIWNFRQNSPELIIRDAKRMLGLNEAESEILRQILLARGVNKWLKARRDIIKLKAEIKEEIKALQATYKRGDKVQKEKLKLLVSFRTALRRICHSPRWVEWPAVASPQKAERGIQILN